MSFQTFSSINYCYMHTPTYVYCVCGINNSKLFKKRLANLFLNLLGFFLKGNVNKIATIFLLFYMKQHEKKPY